MFVSIFAPDAVRLVKGVTPPTTPVNTTLPVPAVVVRFCPPFTVSVKVKLKFRK